MQCVPRWAFLFAGGVNVVCAVSLRIVLPRWIAVVPPVSRWKIRTGERVRNVPFLLCRVGRS